MADQPFHALVRVDVVFIAAVDILVIGQFGFQFLYQSLLVRMFRGAHVEVQHRILYPFLFQPFDGQSPEQFFPAGKVAVQRGGEQALAEAARTAQKHVFGTRMGHAIDIFRLVYIQIVLVSQFGESLNPYGV